MALFLPRSRLAWLPCELGHCGWCSGRRDTSGLGWWLGSLHNGLDLHRLGTGLPPSSAPLTPHSQDRIPTRASGWRVQAPGGLPKARLHCLTLLQAPEPSVHSLLSSQCSGIKCGHGKAGVDRKPNPVCMVTHLWMPAPCSSCGSQHLGTATCRLLGGH